MNTAAYFTLCTAFLYDSFKVITTARCCCLQPTLDTFAAVGDVLLLFSIVTYCYNVSRRNKKYPLPVQGEHNACQDFTLFARFLIVKLDVQYSTQCTCVADAQLSLETVAERENVPIRRERESVLIAAENLHRQRRNSKNCYST